MYILNGEIYRNQVNTVSPISQAFMFGYGLFETLKVIDGQILFFDEHLKRLEEGCETLNLHLNIKLSKIIEDSYRLLKLKNMRNGVLKISYARSEPNNYLVLTTRENTYDQDDYEKGFKVMFSKVKRNQHSILTFIKSNNYMENIIEKEKSKKLGFDEILFVNTDDFLCEGAVSNIFWIKENTVYTPNVECGLLPGIVREKTVVAIKRLGLEVRIGEFTKRDLLNCDEVFITNSVMDIMRVSKIEEKEFKLKENSLTNKITQEYKKLIGEQYGC